MQVRSPKLEYQLFGQGFWRLADPKISLASFSGMFMAACLAATDHSLSPLWLLLTISGIFAVEIAKNASGELVDYDSGADLAVAEKDRTPFSGGKRVLVDSILTRRQTFFIAITFYTTAIIIGLLIVVFRDQRVLFIGLAGIALAWFYHSGPLRLSYRGWGELAVAISYGPLVVLGTYLVQTGTVTATVFHASLVLGVLVAAFLWINEFPDYNADKASGKSNLVVKIGLSRAVYVYLAMLVIGYGWLVFIAVNGDATGGLLGGLLGMPAASFSAIRLFNYNGNTQNLVPAQVASLASFVLMAIGVSLVYMFE
ncbi:MAG: 1,4-dihydroxy-2-naphthoate octaprenyltransferase [Candidatus Krumholzibacteriia bacterium]|jgi:1,4-dihydroxy-2-naphthoate octaprenyltransferase